MRRKKIVQSTATKIYELSVVVLIVVSLVLYIMSGDVTEYDP